MVKILQISTVIENYEQEQDGVMVLKPYTDATVYGLGDDNKMYYWAENEDGTFEWRPTGQ